MPVVMLLAVAAVLVSVFFVATGWGGEMSYERPDHAPLDLGPVSATDIALMRPPTALWGYNMQVTEEALELIARAMRDRDVTIAALQQQLAELSPKESPAVQTPAPRQAPETTETTETAGSVPSSDVRLPPYLRQPSGARHLPEPGQRLEPDQPPQSAQRPEAPPAVESFSPPEVHRSPETPPTSETSRPPAEARQPTGDSPASGSPGPFESGSPAGETPTVESPRPAGIHQPPATPPTRDLLRASPAPQEPQIPERATTSQATDLSQTPLSAPSAADVTQPSKGRARSTASNDPPGPKGSYDARGWWAEQQQASCAEQAADDPSSDVDPLPPGNGSTSAGPPEDEALAAVEEEGW